MIAWLGDLPAAIWLRQEPLAYPMVSAAHILGIGLLLGAILPLDLRLLGAFSATPLAVVGPFLSRVAGAGLAVAAVTGGLLFLAKPAEYLENPAFLAKIALIGLAVLNLALVHLGAGWRRAAAGGPVSPGLRAGAGASALLWLSTLTAGRWIGFL